MYNGHRDRPKIYRKGKWYVTGPGSSKQLNLAHDFARELNRRQNGTHSGTVENRTSVLDGHSGLHAEPMS